LTTIFIQALWLILAARTGMKQVHKFNGGQNVWGQNIFIKGLQ